MIHPLLLCLSCLSPQGGGDGAAAENVAPDQIGPQVPGLERGIHTVRLPLAFERASATTERFVARGAGYACAVDALGVQLVLETGSQGVAPTLVTVGVRVCGADAGAPAAPSGALEGRAHYLIGRDPRYWRTDVARYGRVRYREVLPGIDVVYYGCGSRLEYDFVLAPGISPDELELAIDGASSVGIDGRGDLQLECGGGTLTQLAPRVYQTIAGQRRAVASRYVMRDGRVGFAIGEHDRSRPLVIDPVIAYGTFLGGSGGEDIRAVARDPAGNTYVTGITSSTDFPSAGRPVNGLYDIFVTKIDPTGSQIVYSTLVGGSGGYREDDWPLDIGVDAQGRAVVVGRTKNTDFPTANAAQPQHAGLIDAVVFMLDPSGSAFVYSTFLGGSGFEIDRDQTVGGGAGAVAVDAAGNATVAGMTESSNFPIRRPLIGTLPGTRSGFVTRFDSAGAIAFSTYLGGSSVDEVFDIAADPFGFLYLSGSTRSSDFPTTAGVYSRSNPGGFVLKLDPVTPAIMYSTMFPLAVNAVGVDAVGRVYLAGTTTGGVPTTMGAYQTEHGGSFDSHPWQGWIARLDQTASTLEYATYYGSAAANEGFVAIAADRSGHAYAFGTSSEHFGTRSQGAFLVKLNAVGSDLVYAASVSGRNSSGYAALLQEEGAVWVAGQTWNPSGLSTPGSAQPNHGGATDGFLARIEDDATTVRSLTTSADRVAANRNIQGFVTLDGVAPAGGVTVALASGDPSILTVPASVVVPAGSATATFAISGLPVSAPRPVQVTASWSGAQASATVRVTLGPTYRVVPIVVPNVSVDESHGNGINAFGDVVGSTRGEFFRYGDARGVEILGAGSGWAINDDGQIAGGDNAAFRYTDGVGIELLGALQPGRPSSAYGINAKGQVCGQSGWIEPDGTITARAFLYRDATGMMNLGSFGGISVGRAVNRFRQVTGSSQLSSVPETHLIRFTPGVGLVDLGRLPGDAHATGFAINDAGQMTGRSFTRAFTESRIFLYDDSAGMIDLGRLPGARHAGGNGVNSFGHVVGWSGSTNSPSSGRAVLYTGSSLQPLDELLSAEDAFDWELEEARGINDRGQIVGTGGYHANGGWFTAFRLDPLFFAPYGRGCRGQDEKVAALTGLGRPIGGQRIQLLVTGRPQSSAVIFVSATRGQQTLFGGCELLLGLPFFDLGVLATDGVGNVEQPIDLPSTVLPGGLFLQAAVLDVDAVNGAFTTSNGVEMTVPF